MKKQLIDFRTLSCLRFPNRTALLTLTPADGRTLPAMLPGQFVNIRIDTGKDTFLRRPISIYDVDRSSNSLILYVKEAGEGTGILCASREGDRYNILLPLGNGFPTDTGARKPLLVGGGVGIAPLLYLGKKLKEKGVEPRFLLGGAAQTDLLLADHFSLYGRVDLTTADGSAGVKGFVTDHSSLQNPDCDAIFCCGPTPMMKAVAEVARRHDIDCWVSLENLMACGLGACLCCVEDTKTGHRCVCTDGPVFNINDLKW